MSLQRDLLKQAEHLARKEPRRPKNASLRRAVSTAYYAVFHLLVDAGARMMVRGQDNTDLRLRVSRAFQHGDMKQGSATFAKGRVPNDCPVLTADLKLVAATFVDLQQEQRQRADYDLSASFSKTEAISLIDAAKQCFDAWDRVKATPEARWFLAALIFNKRWNR